MNEKNIEKRSWASVAEGNTSKSAGTAPEYVAPIEVEGVKCVDYSMEEVDEDLQIWNRAVVVYVLGKDLLTMY